MEHFSTEMFHVEHYFLKNTMKNGEKDFIFTLRCDII